MTLTEWRDGGSFYRYNDYSIFYRLSETSDEVVLCLHGFPTSSHDYHKIWNGLTAHFAVLTYDLIGYGFSAKPADFDYTTFNQTDLLQSLLEHLKIKKIHILAQDYGNTLTQELLARAEEDRLNFTIESICLLNGALFPETHRPLIAQRLLISPLGFVFARFITDEIFTRSLSKIFGKATQPSKDELSDFLRIFKINGGRKIAPKLVRYMRERPIYRARWVGALQRTNVPFRFINGLFDPISGASLVRRFREIMPQKDLIELPEIGHFPHFEAPAEILDYFVKFHQIT